jgi:hypothetical protein
VADRLTSTDIACWVLKTRRTPHEILPDWAPGSSRSLTRCLRRSYRVQLMRPGQPCLLWLSGQRDPGVHAIGWLSTAASPPEDIDPVGGPESAVTVSLTLLTETVARPLLLADPQFSTAEVLRMPAGSNPSYLTETALAALMEFLSPGDRQRAGWDRLVELLDGPAHGEHEDRRGGAVRD